MRGTKWYYLTRGSGLLSVGAGIYICFRATELRFFHIFPDGKLPVWLTNIREWLAKTNVPEWIRYSLPDGLWLLSYLLFMDLIWDEGMKPWKLFFLVMLPLGTLIAEILQMFHVIPGTGDLFDLIFYLIAIIIFINIKYLQL